MYLLVTLSSISRSFVHLLYACVCALRYCYCTETPSLYYISSFPSYLSLSLMLTLIHFHFHLLIHPLTRLLTYSLAPLLTSSLTHLLTYSLTRLLTYSLTHSLVILSFTAAQKRPVEQDRYRDKAEFGQVPLYLQNMKAEIAEEKVT